MVCLPGCCAQSIAHGHGPSPAAPKTDGETSRPSVKLYTSAVRHDAATKIMRANIKTTLIVLSISFALVAQLNCNKPGANQSGSNSSQASQPLEPGIAMTAEELVEAYRMVPADGAGKYKGKTIDVTGTVSRKGKDFQSKLYVDLKGQNTVIEVHCTYNADQEEKMSALQPGQQATIRGICDGRFMSHVVLKNSVLVK